MWPGVNNSTQSYTKNDFSDGNVTRNLKQTKKKTFDFLLLMVGAHLSLNINQYIHLDTDEALRA